MRLRENLRVGEQVPVLAERLWKKDTPGKFYKSLTQNKPYFNKNEAFVIRKNW